jgi:hypothetical protein
MEIGQVQVFLLGMDGGWGWKEELAWSVACGSEGAV